MSMTYDLSSLMYQKAAVCMPRKLILMQESAHIGVRPIHKKNSNRVMPLYIAVVQHYYSKRTETAGRSIEKILPKTIHTVRGRGLEFTILVFVLTYSINYL
jgi:hypothetical protein